MESVNKNIMQNTIAKAASASGVGLHTGQEIAFSICPAPANFGIVFKRLDVKANESLIAANFRNVTKTQLGTVIANKHNVEVSTVEHLMAALWGLGIDNAIVTINGPEVPILDGSSDMFVQMVLQAGIKPLKALRKTLVVKEVLNIDKGDKACSIQPANGNSLEVDFDINFDSKAIGEQKASFVFDTTANDNKFVNDISRARTFGFKHEVDYLRSVGLARGGDLSNAIVVEGDEILNQNGLRFDNEFVRHKVLDAVGDLYLCGYNIAGKFTGSKSGHGLNNDLLHTLFEESKNFEIKEPLVA